jgi:hypothetical protein
MEQEPNKVREASAVYMTPDMRRQERAVRRLVRAAVLEHKRAGNPVCELQDGKVVWIQPEDIDCRRFRTTTTSNPRIICLPSPGG